MSISRRVARPLLSSIFIVGGMDAARHPDTKTKAADPVVQKIAGKVPGVPQDTQRAVQLNGAVMVGAGTLLALGKWRRLSSLALIATIVPTTYAGHRFWEETDERTKAQQRVHFLKNLGLLGGLILALVDTEGAPSLSWRAKRRMRRTGQATSAGRSKAAKQAKGALAAAEDLMNLVVESGVPAVEHAARAATEVATESVEALSRKAQKAQLKERQKAAQQAFIAQLKEQHEAATKARKAAAQAAKEGRKSGAKAAKNARKSGAKAAKNARKAGAERAKEAQKSAAKAAAKGRKQAARAAAKGRASAAGVAEKGWPAASEQLTAGVHAAGDALSKAADRLPVGVG
jgi:uncharacterized membrane protein YphA (DoxX/SURF4 family)